MVVLPRILVAQDVEYLRYVYITRYNKSLFGGRVVVTMAVVIAHPTCNMVGMVLFAEIAQLVVACDSYSQGRWFEPTSRYNFKWCTTFGIHFVKAL